jgi:hypothetical protein
MWPLASSVALQRYVRSWSTSRHSADIVNVRLQPRHVLLIGSGPRSRSGSLADIGGKAPWAGTARLAL